MEPAAYKERQEKENAAQRHALRHRQQVPHAEVAPEHLVQFQARENQETEKREKQRVAGKEAPIRRGNRVRHIAERQSKDRGQVHQGDVREHLPDDPRGNARHQKSLRSAVGPGLCVMVVRSPQIILKFPPPSILGRQESVNGCRE